jgi:hypothetical protein
MYDVQKAYDTNSMAISTTTDTLITNMTLTAQNLGGSGMYNVSFTCGRANSSGNQDTYFYVKLNGTVISQVRVSTYSNEIHSLALSALIDNVVSGDVITITTQTAGGTHTIYERELIITGINKNYIL